MMRLRTLRRLCAAVVLPGCMLLGCGTPKRGAADTSSKAVSTAAPTSTATAAPGTAEEQAKKDALDAYFGLMGDWQAGLASPDNQVSGLLPQHASDQALALVANDIQRSRRDGVITKGKLLISPNVTKIDLSANPPVAQVDDCADTSDYNDYHVSDGSPVKTGTDVAGGRQYFLAHVRKEGRAWRVYDLHFYQVGSCK